MAKRAVLISSCLVFFMLAGLGEATVNESLLQQKTVNPALAALLPKVEGWQEEETRRSYFPETLFEYINGAAESYLSYDFRELLVAQYNQEASGANLTVEIYDMGTSLNAFGIFSAERYPDNKPVNIGDLGYMEDSTFNFFAGRYYVKVVAFGLDDQGQDIISEFALKIDSAIKEKGVLPPLLSVFPRENLVPQSEKYIKKNFMGQAFLHDGYSAGYKFEGNELEAFFVDAASEKEADQILNQFLDFFLNDRLIPEKIADGYRIKNRYSQFTYLSRVKNIICGLNRVNEAMEKEGETLFKMLTSSVNRFLSKKSVT